MIQPSDLTPTDWLRAVEAAFPGETPTIALARGLVWWWNPQVRLSTPRITQLVETTGLHRERITQRLGRLKHAGAISVLRVDRLTSRTRRKARRADRWGHCYALLMSWAATTLDPENDPAAAPRLITSLASGAGERTDVTT